MNSNLSDSLKIYRKTSILFIAFVSMLIGIESYASDKTTYSDTIILKPKGRFIFGDEKSNDIYLLDTHTGRLWRNKGSSGSPENFVKIQYIDKSGSLIDQPEETTKAEQYDGRFMFKDIHSNDYYIFDREIGAVWKLGGSIGSPTKLVPVIVDK